MLHPDGARPGALARRQRLPTCRPLIRRNIILSTIEGRLPCQPYYHLRSGRPAARAGGRRPHLSRDFRPRPWVLQPHDFTAPFCIITSAAAVGYISAPGRAGPGHTPGLPRAQPLAGLPRTHPRLHAPLPALASCQPPHHHRVQSRAPAPTSGGLAAASPAGPRRRRTTALARARARTTGGERPLRLGGLCSNAAARPPICRPSTKSTTARSQHRAPLGHLPSLTPKTSSARVCASSPLLGPWLPPTTLCRAARQAPRSPLLTPVLVGAISAPSTAEKHRWPHLYANACCALETTHHPWTPPAIYTARLVQHPSSPSVRVTRPACSVPCINTFGPLPAFTPRAASEPPSHCRVPLMHGPCCAARSSRRASRNPSVVRQRMPVENSTAARGPPHPARIADAACCQFCSVSAHGSGCPAIHPPNHLMPRRWDGLHLLKPARRQHKVKFN